VLSVTKIQRQLDELNLSGLNAVLADLYLVEPDLAGLPPGEDVEEAAERSAVGSPQSVEGNYGPGRRAGLGERLGGRGGEPLRAQFATVTVDPNAAPAVISQVVCDG
jgi:hypothetical protein